MSQIDLKQQQKIAWKLHSYFQLQEGMQKLEDTAREYVLLDTRTAELFPCNETAGFLLHQLQNQKDGVTSTQLAHQMCAEFAVEIAQADQDISRFLNRLRHFSMIESVFS